MNLNHHTNKKRRMKLLLLSVIISSTESFLTQAPTSIHPIPHEAAPVRTPLHHFAYRNDHDASSAPLSTVTSSPAKEAPILSKKPPSHLPNGGCITLLGAGPGDPDLLTVKAYKLLQDPNNLVIVDRLVSEEVLDVIRGEVKRAKKYPGCAEQVRCLNTVAHFELYMYCMNLCRVVTFF